MSKLICAGQVRTASAGFAHAYKWQKQHALPPALFGLIQVSLLQSRTRSVPASPDDTSCGASEKAKSNFQLEEDVWGGGPTGTLATAGCDAIRPESTGTVCTASRPAVMPALFRLERS